MRKFKFRLETLERIRRQQEDSCKIALGRAVARVQEARMRLEGLLAEKDELETLRRQVLNGSLKEAGNLQDFERYQELLRRRIEETRQELALRMKEEEQARGEMLEAKRKTQVLEKLRDRQEERHRLESQRLDQVELEDMEQARRAGRRARGEAREASEVGEVGENPSLSKG